MTAIFNRYFGNSGRVERVPEPEAREVHPEPAAYTPLPPPENIHTRSTSPSETLPVRPAPLTAPVQAPAQTPKPARLQTPRPVSNPAPHRPAPPAAPVPAPPQPFFQPLDRGKGKQPAETPGGRKQGGLLGSLASKLDLSKLETEDLILMLILYLLYRESGDEELLIIMGAMFLL